MMGRDDGEVLVRPKIVVLDGHALNPGDLSWEQLAQLGELTIHPRTALELVVERAAGADIVLTNKTRLPAEFLERLPQLRYIGVMATGYDVVDVAFACSRGIVVTNVPEYGTRSVAQMVFALLLELTNHVGLHARRVRDGAWSASPDWCFWERPLIELASLTLGIVGYGNIGRAVASTALSLGMKVLVTTRRAADPSQTEVEWVDLPSLLKASDVVTLHCPLVPDTRHLIDTPTLSLMKPGAVLINTARGRLINESALAAALEDGRLAGAALDVLSSEPPPPDHPLLRAKNCIITPHHAWATRAARERLLGTVVENIRSFLSGEPSNVVRPPG